MKKIITSITSVLALILVASAAFVVYVGSQPEEPVNAKTDQQQKKPTVNGILALINEERAKVGAQPLVIDDNVQQSAQLKADDMSKNSYFSHIMPSTGKVLSPEMDKLLSSTCIDSSENIRDNDITINTNEEAVAAWKNSTPHYKALVDGRYSKTGIGISGDKIVQHFCIAK